MKINKRKSEVMLINVKKYNKIRIKCGETVLEVVTTYE